MTSGRASARASVDRPWWEPISTTVERGGSASTASYSVRAWSRVNQPPTRSIRANAASKRGEVFNGLPLVLATGSPDGLGRALGQHREGRLVGRAFARVVPDALTAVVVLALTWPMWTAGGYGLARDMVFTPRAPWTLDAIGMGTSLPRAVPLDVVLAMATSLVDGAVVFRVAIAGVLLLAGWGAHRLVADLVPGAPVTARFVVAVAAVWNPYVVERLALGQWALLAGYAALWWLLPAVRRVLAGDRRGWPAVVAWTWLGSLTPTGGAVLASSLPSPVSASRSCDAPPADAHWPSRG